MKNAVVLVVLLLASSAGYERFLSGPPPGSGETETTLQQTAGSDAAFAEAFAKGASGLQLEGAGTVVRLLADDMRGSRHQRFIVKLSSGQTVLIAHNIDLAPRLSSLRIGDRLRFAGQYEWNAEGGILHWTHRDPDGLHQAGWIDHGGKRYQ